MRYKEKSINKDAIYLIIVESPSKCSKIEHFLGKDYCCIASMGHLRKLTGLTSINTKGNFEPTFSFIEEKRKHISKMDEIIKRFLPENIILASDDDREGEAIAWHICEIFSLSVTKTKRIIFHEITKQAIIDAIKNPITINMNLVQAQHARQILDIIVGYKVSPFLWKYLYNNKENSLSAGRCQTPALHLIYENELKQNEDAEVNYKTTGLFTSKKLEFSLNHQFTEENQVENFLKESVNHNHNITINDGKDTEKSSPIPFQTSKLLQTANNVLHYSPKQTMDVCQKLYQAGYITYMRTESTKYSQTFINKACTYIEKRFNKDFIGNIAKIKNTDSNNPHEAIRVTNLETTSVNGDENKKLNALYKMIWKNTLQSCMKNAKYKNYKLEIDAPQKHKYNYNIEYPLFLGWKTIEEKESLENLQTISNGLLFFCKQLKNPVPYEKIETHISVTNKHPHYSESSLIQKLEKIGIGRPSTYASIVHTLLEREYVLKKDVEGKKLECTDFTLHNKTISKTKQEKIFNQEKNKLVIQPVGILCIEFLIKNFTSIFSYDYTENMETELDLISNGSFDKEWNIICKNCYEEIKHLGDPLKSLKKLVFDIDSEHVLMFEKHGPVLQKKSNKKEYISVNPEIQIDIQKLKNYGEYNLDDLIEKKPDYLGIYDNEKVYIKNGKYGYYAEWGEKRESLKKCKTPIKDLTIDIFIQFIESNETKPYLRKLNDFMEIRRGKFGMYVYYKTPEMKKPSFLNIKKCKLGVLTCEIQKLIDWINETYNLNEKVK